MKRHDKLADTLPVGTLGILALIPPARVLVPARRKASSTNLCVEMICIY